MGLLDFLSGEFIDVIEWTDDSRDTMVWRFERYGHAIKYGAKLTVREGQAAVFVNEGQIADVFTPGLYMLETNNMPVLTTLQHWDHGFRSPFQCEVYFVSTTRFNDQKWGTKNPVICRDSEFGVVRLRAFGTYSMRVSDPARFLREVVGTDGDFTAEDISVQIRNVIVQEFSRVVAASAIPVLDMAANTADFGALVVKAIEPTVGNYGLTLPEFYVENISLPDAVEAVLDKRTSMGIVGDLNRYMQFNAAEAMGQPGSGASQGMGAAMGAGIGAGMGMAMGGQMAATQAGAQPGWGPWGQMPNTQSLGAQAVAPQPAPQPTQPPVAGPPPVPQEKVWHVARDGAATGPFNRAALGGMAGQGALTRDTLVWTPGQDGWKRAEEIADLAPLFTSVPPPLPPVPPSVPPSGQGA